MQSKIRGDSEKQGDRHFRDGEGIRKTETGESGWREGDQKQSKCETCEG